MLANKYLKKWSGIPTRGCTNLSIFHPYLMGLKTPSQLYLEGHAGNYMVCKVKADSQVNFALQSQLSRESQWVGKSSTVVQCNDIYEKVSEDMLIPTPENCHNFQSCLATQLPKLKEAVRLEVQFTYLEKWNSRIKDLLIQGDFLKLLEMSAGKVSSTVCPKVLCNLQCDLQPTALQHLTKK